MQPATEPRRPAPILTDDNAFYWEAAADGQARRPALRRLRGACAIRRGPCAGTASRSAIEVVPLSGRGTLYSYAVLHHPQNPAFDYPVLAALVDLDEGIRLLSELDRCRARRHPHRHGADGRLRPDRRRHGRAGASSRRASMADRLRMPRSPASATPSSPATPAAPNCSWPARRSSAALKDAGLTPADVDGIVSYTIDPVEETELVRSVGHPGDRLLLADPLRRRRFDGHAAACGERGHSRRGRRRGRPTGRSGPDPGRRVSAAPRPRRARRPQHSGTTAMQWAMPHGVLTPASWMALNATRYMHQYGVTSEDFGRAVVQLREYAANNPAAWGYERPMTLEDHQDVALDRRALHASAGLLPGDRRLGGAGHHPRRAGRRR